MQFARISLLSNTNRSDASQSAKCHKHTAQTSKSCIVVKSSGIHQHTMNYTLKQLADRVNSMIKEQGEDAECAAWIYTKNDCHLKDEDGNLDYVNNVEDPALIARIFDDVGNIDYIYEVIQDCVDVVTEENLMLYQQEMV